MHRDRAAVEKKHAVLGEIFHGAVIERDTVGAVDLHGLGGVIDGGIIDVAAAGGAKENSAPGAGGAAAVEGDFLRGARARAESLQIAING